MHQLHNSPAVNLNQLATSKDGCFIQSNKEKNSDKQHLHQTVKRLVVTESAVLLTFGQWISFNSAAQKIISLTWKVMGKTN